MTKTASDHSRTTILASILALSATIGLFSVPDTAMAQASQEIRFSDLDLATVSGQKTLERRIQRAAREVCGLDQVRTGTRVASPSATECYQQALHGAREHVAAATASASKGG